jgi:hypothetical protein
MCQLQQHRDNGTTGYISLQIFRKCTLLDGNKGEKSLYKTLKKNIQMKVSEG